MNEDERKHLDLIQGVINRLAGNSFSAKAWAVGLIAVLGSLAAKDANARISCAMLVPAVCFWFLDAYYLRQERLFRKLYEGTIANPSTVAPFSLNTQPVKDKVRSTIGTAFSPSVAALHIPILLFVIGLFVYSLVYGSLPARSGASSASSSVHSAAAH